MRRMTLLIAVAAVTVFLGLGPAASAQTASTLPGVPAGQGGPDNQVNTSDGGNAPGGRSNPAVNAGPAIAEDGGASLAPWLVGAALLVVLAAGGLVMARRGPVVATPTRPGAPSPDPRPRLGPTPPVRPR